MNILGVVPLTTFLNKCLAVGVRVKHYLLSGPVGRLYLPRSHLPWGARGWPSSPSSAGGNSPSDFAVRQLGVRRMGPPSWEGRAQAEVLKMGSPKSWRQKCVLTQRGSRKLFVSPVLDRVARGSRRACVSLLPIVTREGQRSFSAWRTPVSPLRASGGSALPGAQWEGWMA